LEGFLDGEALSVEGDPVSGLFANFEPGGIFERVIFPRFPGLLPFGVLEPREWRCDACCQACRVSETGCRFS